MKKQVPSMDLVSALILMVRILNAAFFVVVAPFAAHKLALLVNEVFMRSLGAASSKLDVLVGLAVSALISVLVCFLVAAYVDKLLLLADGKLSRKPDQILN